MFIGTLSWSLPTAADLYETSISTMPIGAQRAVTVAIVVQGGGRPGSLPGSRTHSPIFLATINP